MITKNASSLKTILVMFFSALLMACGSKSETLNGSDTTAFRLSREAMEKNLSLIEREKLEKAMRVMLLSAMTEIFNDTTANNITLDDLIMKKADAKNYKQIVEFAENYLKEKNEKEKRKTNIAIQELVNRKHKTDSLISILNTLKGTFSKADLDDNGHLTFYSEFTNNSNEYIDTYGLGITVDLLLEDGIEVSCGNVFIGTNEIAPGKKKEYACSMAYTYQQVMQDYTHTPWRGIKLPLTDLKTVEKYFRVNIFTSQLRLHEINYQLPDDAFDKESQSELENLTEALKVLENTKGTLDELQLTTN